MCSNCQAGSIGRRDILKLSAAGLLAVGLGGGPGMARAAEGDGTALSPDEALAALKSGNRRYIDNPQLCAVDLTAQREQLSAGQAPWATIVGCADSRVPPELLFGGHGLGSLFVARNAGNLVDSGTLGTVEYGAAVLHAADSRAGPYPLRRRIGSLRRRREQCDLSRRDRTVAIASQA